MFKSVFSRLIVSYLVILTVVLSIQSIMMVMFYQQDYIDDKKDALIKEANAISVMAAEMMQNPRLNLNTRDFVKYTYFALQRTDSTVWVTDDEGNIAYVGEPGINVDLLDNESRQDIEDAAPLSQQEYEDFMQTVMDGEVLIIEGDYTDRFDKSMLTVGVPVYSVGINNVKTVIGAVFMHVELDELRSINNPVNKQIYISALIMMIMGILAAAFNASRISKPLRSMSNITSNVTQGEFDTHVEVKGSDEIAKLADGLNHMVDELKRQETLRGGFVANVSHELRSPLTSMQGFAQGLLDGTIPEEDRDKYVNIILDETRRLNKLIKDLLDLAQIESGNFPLNIQRFELNELIRRVIIRYIDRMEDKGIELEVDFRKEYYYVNADSDRIEQVIINLIDNAIKFTPKGGTIKIWAYNSQNKVYTSISDTGLGIPKEDLPYIFERFYKVDKAHTEKTGTGLGLSIINRIIKQHDQTITVNSELNKGTSFVFSLDESEEE